MRTQARVNNWVAITQTVYRQDAKNAKHRTKLQSCSWLFNRSVPRDQSKIPILCYLFPPVQIPGFLGGLGDTAV